MVPETRVSTELLSKSWGSTLSFGDVFARSNLTAKIWAHKVTFSEMLTKASDRFEESWRMTRIKQPLDIHYNKYLPLAVRPGPPPHFREYLRPRPKSVRKIIWTGDADMKLPTYPTWSPNGSNRRKPTWVYRRPALSYWWMLRTYKQSDLLIFQWHDQLVVKALLQVLDYIQETYGTDVIYYPFSISRSNLFEKSE